MSRHKMRYDYYKEKDGTYTVYDYKISYKAATGLSEADAKAKCQTLNRGRELPEFDQIPATGNPDDDFSGGYSAAEMKAWKYKHNC